MALDDVYKVTISALGQGSIYQNVFNVQMKTAPDPTPTMFATFANAWADVALASTANTVTYTDWEAVQQWGPNMSIDAPRCRRLNGNQMAGLITGKVGTGTGDMLPPQCAAVTTWLTGVAGRRKRGRSYTFGFVEAVQADGLWTAGLLTGMTSNLNVFINQYHATTGTNPNLRLGVWSERTASGCVPATPPNKGHIPLDTPHPELAFTGVTSYLFRTVVHNQRRRSRGVGR